MKFRDAGLSAEDLDEVVSLAFAACQLLEDENGAPPPQTVGNPPVENPDYVRFIRLHSLVQVFRIFKNQAAAYDTANGVTTDPVVIMAGQSGTF